jgi:squalene-hopene/tetraprenyl-beta-curcumene cyclase
MVPLMVLAALKPRAKNPKGIGVDELFLQYPRTIGMTAKAPHQSWAWFLLFRGLDIVLRAAEPLFPKKMRARAIDSAIAFIEERLNGEDGLGAIFPPMANAVMMYAASLDPSDRASEAATDYRCTFPPSLAKVICVQWTRGKPSISSTFSMTRVFARA